MSSPFEIYSTSTALLRKFQSSTYHRYACGWNLLSALYLYCLFQKAYGRGIFKRDGCTVCGTSTASHAENKCSTYNKYVSALFSANSLYLHRLFSKGALLKYTAHLRRCLLSEVRLCTSLNKSLLCKLAAQRCARRCILGRGCP
ncbi:hypothetical protein HMPREF1222_01324 [Treponema vincentii F0403]|uniref:Uncharacterized protein n=1 Tax=Treponema vincentii F0403 TaxID=1125702 RepID=S3LQY3_9SPIR|nr:hypothetical protein HMPREF1222_01324 [Treponema vincentii F0403]